MATQTKLEAGPELDRTVAEAIGLEVLSTQSLSDEIIVDFDTASVFAPSTDLNSAVIALDKVFAIWLIQKLAGPDVRVGQPYLCRGCPPAGDGLDTVQGFGPTPALAACAAILKVAEAE